MKTYLVGGAVRDKLLQLDVVDRDWVVVGTTPEQMIELGYKPVGKDFPVFIKPQSGEEYALARTERKTAKGYQGFSFNTSPDITLEDDLARRDLTINAIAESSKGELIDPFNGQADLKSGVLRHVSDAFLEDPVRILRVARFAARFNFRIADETMLLMQTMVSNGEVDSLVAERVWGEFHKALSTNHPARFIQTLRDCGALAKILPEIDVLFGIPQRKEYHPEIDTGIHTLMVLEQAAKLTNEPIVRFAALLHDLGKAKTPEDKWPTHHGHEKLGVPVIKSLCQRLRVPSKFRELAAIVSEYHLNMHRIDELKDATVLKMLESTGSLRSPERAIHFTQACEADARGRTGLENRDYPQSQHFLQLVEAANSINSADIAKTANSGEAIKQAIRKSRIYAIRNVRQDFRSTF
ncbi:MAG: multifunctional CCA addition/repair protein [Arenicella sp.]